MSTWTKFATKFYQQQKKKNPDYKFSQALKDAAKAYKKRGDDKVGGGDDDEVPVVEETKSEGDNSVAVDGEDAASMDNTVDGEDAAPAAVDGEYADPAAVEASASNMEELDVNSLGGKKRKNSAKKGKKSAKKGKKSVKKSVKKGKKSAKKSRR